MERTSTTIQYNTVENSGKQERQVEITGAMQQMSRESSQLQRTMDAAGDALQKSKWHVS